MKIPKSLLHSILVGVSAGTFAACSLDIVVTPVDVFKEVVTTCNGDNGQDEPKADPCPACGMG